MALKDLKAQLSLNNIKKAAGNIINNFDQDKSQSGFQFTAPGSKARERVINFQNTVNRFDMDKSMPGFQVAKGGFSAGVDRVKQSFKDDPSQYFVLSPTAMRQGQASADYLASKTENPLLEFGLGASKELMANHERGASNIVSGFQNRNPLQVGTGAFQVAKPGIAAYGGLGKAAATGLIGSGLVGGISRLQGMTGDELASEAGKAFTQGFNTRAITQFTDPAIGRLTDSVGGNLLAKQFGQRGVAGVGNVIEDRIINYFDGIKDNQDAASFILGAALAGNIELSKAVRNKLADALASGNSKKVNAAVKVVREQLRDQQGRFTVAKANGSKPTIAEMAIDPEINLADVPAKVRKAINEYRFNNDIDPTKLGKGVQFKLDPENPNRLLRVEMAKSRLGSGNAEFAAGFGFGIEPEYDEDGNIVGMNYDANKGFLGAAGIIAGTRGRKQLAKAVDTETIADVAQKGLKQIEDSKRETQSVQDYIANQVSKQKSAGEASKLKGAVSQFVSDVRKNVVDFTTPITDILDKAEKSGKFNILPQSDIRYQIDRALRSDTLASQFIKDNGLVKVIQDVDDMDTFNQYLIAKQAGRVAQRGIETGRDLKADKKMVEALADQYEPFAQQIKKYTDNLLQYKVDAGFITKDTADELRRIYPDYVPLKRVFNEIEQEALSGGTGKKGIASVGTQKVLQRLQGSTREIHNPIESLVEATGVAFAQGERNRAAQMLLSYKSIPENPFNLRQLDPSEKVGTKSVINAFIDGKKVTYETLPEVAEAAKNLSAQQLSILGKVLSVPTRVLQMGAVGVNIPFVIGNLVKDQVTASVLSDKAMKTSVANPLNFVKALYAAVGKNDLYDDWVRSGSSFTQFDIARGSVAPEVDRIRAGKSASEKIKYIAKNPGELLRSLEDFIGTTEELTRIQQFEGTRQALLSEGRTMADADILAGNASRMNTANFGRRGNWSSVLNGAIPFFNAGIQGARSLRKAVEKDPKGTAVRFATTVGLPITLATMWNKSDPVLAAAYEDIPEWEKENNLIFLPPGVQQDEDGKYKAIKIPIPPGLSNLASIIRRQVEGTAEYDLPGISQILGDLTAAATSIDPSNPRQLATNFVPQGAKPFVEGMVNQNLFTGRELVPSYMKDLPPEEQVFSDTSASSRAIGKVLGVSPLVVDNAISTAGAGAGRQIQRAVDTALVRAGVATEEQIGGEGVFENMRNRFARVRGGQKASEIYKDIADNKARIQTRNSDIKAAYIAGDMNLVSQLSEGVDKGTLKRLISSAEEKEMRELLTPTQKAIQSMSKEEREQYVKIRPDMLQDLMAVQAAEAKSTKTISGDGDTSFYARLHGVDEIAQMPDDSRYEKSLKMSDAYTKGVALLKEDLPDSVKSDLMKDMGITLEDVQYYDVANDKVDQKTLYVLDNVEQLAAQTNDRSQLLNYLSTLRKEVNGNILASKGVLDNLVDEGLISEAEAKQLNSFTFNNEDGTPTVKVSGRGGGARLKKISVSSPSVGKAKLVDQGIDFKKTNLRAVNTGYGNSQGGARIRTGFDVPKIGIYS